MPPRKAFTTFPLDGRLWPHLEVLALGHNRITVVPESVGHMHSLSSLSLHNNRIRKVHAGIGRCTNLRILSLARNSALITIPPSLGLCVYLNKVSVDFENIILPPDDVSSFFGGRTVAKFLRGTCKCVCSGMCMRFSCTDAYIHHPFTRDHPCHTVTETHNLAQACTIASTLLVWIFHHVAC